jgi:ATP-binding protein involved in chromosome partitioning
MPSPTPDEVRAKLDTILYPGFRHSLVRIGLVKGIEIDDGRVAVALAPASRHAEVAKEVRERIRRGLMELPGVRAVEVTTAEAPGAQDHGHAHGHSHAHEAGGAQAPAQEAIPGVGAILAVSSCKGGVGKSTVAANLASALAAQGVRVGLLDADVYGPSVPLMMGVDAKPQAVGGKVAPLESHGVALMSMGFFLDDKSPVIWRGPMVMGLIRQFLRDVDWGRLDILVVDMPPGTGDAALTLAQQVPITGAIVVTTPQEVALADVERGISMFRQVHVPVLGIVENMSGYVCPDCGETEEIFGSGGGESLARQFGVKLLERLPLVPTVRECGDAGKPIVLAEPDQPVSQAFRRLAESMRQTLSLHPEPSSL